jgi:hypothetical protein
VQGVFETMRLVIEVGRLQGTDWVSVGVHRLQGTDWVSD